jgi:hypothetical protein
MSAGLLKAVCIQPGKAAYQIMLANQLDDLQEAVGGMIEFTYPFDEDGICLLGNDEAKLIGMEGCRRIGSAVYAGPIYVMGYGADGECKSLTDEQVDRYTQMFAVPEDIPKEEVEADMGFTFMSFR